MMSVTKHTAVQVYSTSILGVESLQKYTLQKEPKKELIHKIHLELSYLFILVTFVLFCHIKLFTK